MRIVHLDPGQFPGRRCVCQMEGGTVYEAELGEFFYVIQDESTLAWMLDEADLQGTRLINTLEFDTAAERAAYVQERFGLRLEL